MQIDIVYTLLCSQGIAQSYLPEQLLPAVNQSWVDAHPIPDDKQRITSFTAIDEMLTKRFTKMLHTLKTQKNLSADE